MRQLLLTLPLLFVLVEYARRAMRKSFRQIRVRLAAMNAFAQEHLFGIRVVHLLGRGTIAQREYDEINAGHRDAYLLQIRADAAMYAAKRAGKGAGMFGGAGVAGHFVLLFLSISLWWALGDGMGHGWSALIVAMRRRLEGMPPA